MKSRDLPIGYWIRKADELLTKGIDAVQSSFGLNRTGWQVLNSLSESDGQSFSDLAALIKPFADESAVANIVNSLRVRQLLREDDGQLRLTDEGRKIHRDCLERQQAFRERCVREVSREEYETTVLTLKKLVANLEK